MSTIRMMAGCECSGHPYAMPGLIVPTSQSGRNVYNNGAYRSITDTPRVGSRMMIRGANHQKYSGDTGANAIATQDGIDQKTMTRSIIESPSYIALSSGPASAQVIEDRYSWRDRVQPAGCWCCPERIELIGVAPYDRGVQEGHQFGIRVTLKPQGSGTPIHGCVLLWWEKCNFPLDLPNGETSNPGTWNLVNRGARNHRALMAGNPVYNQLVTTLSLKCSGIYEAKNLDRPITAGILHGNGVRILWIVLIVLPADGASCHPQFLWIEQILVIRNGRVDYGSSSIQTVDAGLVSFEPLSDWNMMLFEAGVR